MEAYQTAVSFLSQERGSHKISGLERPSEIIHGNTHAYT